MTLEQVRDALAQAQPEKGRQQIIHTASGITVVDDAYNANPDSMKASLATFSTFKVEGRRIAVLGDMGELGDFAYGCHRRVGEYAAAANLDILVCVGELARAYHTLRLLREMQVQPVDPAVSRGGGQCLDILKSRADK